MRFTAWLLSLCIFCGLAEEAWCAAGSSPAGAGTSITIYSTQLVNVTITTNLTVINNETILQTNFVNVTITTNLTVINTNIANYTITTNLIVYQTNIVNQTITTNLTVINNETINQTNFVNYTITTNLTVINEFITTNITVTGNLKVVNSSFFNTEVVTNGISEIQSNADSTQTTNMFNFGLGTRWYYWTNMVTNVVVQLTNVWGGGVSNRTMNFFFTGATNGGPNYTVLFTVPNPAGVAFRWGVFNPTNGATSFTVTNNSTASAVLTLWNTNVIEAFYSPGL